MIWSMKKSMLALLLLAGWAGAQSQTGPNIYYHLRKDAMTDANTSTIIIREGNDLSFSTYIVLACQGDGSYDLYLRTKHILFTPNELQAYGTPKVMCRVDSRPAQTMNTLPVMNEGQSEVISVGFSPAGDVVIHKALIAANNLKLRILRHSQSSLDYTFPAKGYIAAFAKINNCK